METLILLGLFLLPAPVIATTSPIMPVELTIDEKITKYASEYKVDETLMRKVIKCESSFNPNAVGDKGTSYGLSQIHLPAHPDITKEQATNEDFAINFMAKEFSKNNMKIWSCYKIVTDV